MSARAGRGRPDASRGGARGRGGGWRGLARALALAWGVLAGSGSAAGAESAADLAIYGPVDEYLLGGNNPPIPEPRGRRWLRDGVPGAAEGMARWPAFFRDTELTLHLRSYYFNREIRDEVFQEAWALGGWLGYESGWLLDTFRVGAVGYTSQPAYAPEDRDGTGLLAPGQEGILVLGQAFGQLRYKDYALLTGGRQLVNQGYVNPQDNRMIPNTFEGATLTGTVGPVDYALGYLTAMKTRTAEEFVNMAGIAGVFTGHPTDEHRGLLLTTVRFAPGQGGDALAALRGLELYLGNYHVPDAFNTLYVNPDYRHALGDDWRVRFGLQYWDQRSVGDQLIGDFSTWHVSFRGELAWGGLAFLAMMAATGPRSGLVTPYGAWPGYVSLIDTDFNGANEKAWEVGVTYDWGRATRPERRVPGLFTSLLYAEGRGRERAGVEQPTRREADLFVVWRPPGLPGLQLRTLLSLIDDRSASGSLLYDVRFILDLELPLF